MKVVLLGRTWLFAVLAATAAAVALSGCSNGGGHPAAAGSDGSPAAGGAPATKGMRKTVDDLGRRCVAAEETLADTYMCVSTDAVDDAGNNVQDAESRAIGDAALPLCRKVSPPAPAGVDLSLGAAGIGAKPGDPDSVLHCYWQYPDGSLEVNAFQMPSDRTAKSCVDGISGARSYPDGSYGSYQPGGGADADVYARCFADGYEVLLRAAPPNGPFARDYGALAGALYAAIDKP